MKKRLTTALCLCLCAAGCFGLPVRAETLSGGSDWKVDFTSDNKMESNFKTDQVYERVSDLQPGDDVIFTISLKNSNSRQADWYVSNEAISSMEEAGAGGAYSYELRYNDKVLFSSDTVGGSEQNARSAEDKGLSSATDTLKDYVYLDTLKQGQKGTLILRVGMEGESQGNVYQGSTADLEMKFAVEVRAGGGNSGGSGGSGGSGASVSGNTRTQIVQTGDEAGFGFWFLMAGASGLLLLFLAFYVQRQNRKEEKEGAAK